MGYFVLLTLIIVGFLGSSSCQALTMPKEKHCKHFPGADIDDTWFDTISEWEAVDGSKMETDMGPPVPIPHESTLKHKKCYSLALNVPLGTYYTLNECRYNKFSEQYCHLKTEGSPINQFFKFQGSYFFTKTDNKTYVVAYGCGNVVNKFWTLFLADGKELDEDGDTKKEILEHVVSLGFETDTKDRKSDEDSVSAGTMKKSGCSGFPIPLQDSRPNVKLSQARASEIGKYKPKDPAFEEMTKLLSKPLAVFKVA